MATVKINLTPVFNKVATLDEVKALANDLVAQVKNAYEVRAKEIMAAAKAVKEDDVIEVEVADEQEEQVVETPKSTEKAKPASKASKAKEAAEKFKKQKSETPVIETPKATTKSKSADVAEISITDTAAVKKLGLKFEVYSDKCWVLRGDTKPIRNSLKELGGTYNKWLKGGEGWVFRSATAPEVAKALGLKIKVA